MEQLCHSLFFYFIILLGNLFRPKNPTSACWRECPDGEHFQPWKTEPISPLNNSHLPTHCHWEMSDGQEKLFQIRLFLQLTSKFQRKAATKGSFFFFFFNKLNCIVFPPNRSLPPSPSLSELSFRDCVHCTSHYVTDIRSFKQYLFLLSLFLLLSLSFHPTNYCFHWGSAIFSLLCWVLTVNVCLNVCARACVCVCVCALKDSLFTAGNCTHFPS